MFSQFNSLVIRLLSLLSILGAIRCLNITQTSVEPSAVMMAPEPVKLICDKQEDNENDTFQYLEWHKLVDSHWKLVKRFPLPEAESSEASTEGDSSNGTEPVPPKPKLEFYNLDALTATDDSNLELSRTSLQNAGHYKCVVKSSSETTEMSQELKVIYKPTEDEKPEVEVKINDNHITAKCISPPSYPMTALTFFVQYEEAPHEEVHRLASIRINNTNNDWLLRNVQEVRFRATKETVFNGKITVTCVATLTDLYHSSAVGTEDFNGSLYDSKCLSPAIIALIIILVIVSLVILVAVVWIYLRKKKLNSLNKVAELFNKQKTITVMVDNNPNEVKIE